MILHTGQNLIMTEERVTFHLNDPPWVTEDFKRFVGLRQRALHSDNNATFKFYRNKVKSEWKLCQANCYASKVSHLKQSKSKDWWREVKRTCGMTSLLGSTNLLSQL